MRYGYISRDFFLFFFSFENLIEVRDENVRCLTIFFFRLLSFSREVFWYFGNDG